MDLGENAPVSAVIIGRAESSEAAGETAANYRSCPYSAYYGSEGTTVVGILVLPKSKRWWAELPQSEPRLLGLETATVLLTDCVVVQSPWSGGEVKPSGETAPCGEDCTTCRHYHEACEGCPATVHAGRS